MNLTEVELPSNKKFGFFFTVIFLITAGYFWYEINEPFAYSFFIISALFLITTLVKADVLLPLNKLWMRFGLLLGKIVSPIVFGLIFFVLFTPIAVAMRLCGRDELRLRFREKSSHWIKRDTPLQPNSFKHQF
jgi:hypothetical protein